MPDTAPVFSLLGGHRFYLKSRQLPKIEPRPQLRHCWGITSRKILHRQKNEPAIIFGEYKQSLPRLPQCGGDHCGCGTNM